VVGNGVKAAEKGLGRVGTVELVGRRRVGVCWTTSRGWMVALQGAGAELRLLGLAKRSEEIV